MTSSRDDEIVAIFRIGGGTAEKAAEIGAGEPIHGPLDARQRRIRALNIAKSPGSPELIVRQKVRPSVLPK